MSLLNAIINIYLHVRRGVTMYDSHFYTLNGVCPCKIEETVVERAAQIFEKFPDPMSFAIEMNRENVIGKGFWYSVDENTIFITKISAEECGGGCSDNNTLVGRHCHCDHYNHSKEKHPKYYCKCAAEFYRPLFGPLFGENVLMEPYETVLSGDNQCTIAVRLGKFESPD
ncbi:hypothetical protein [Oceanirhabdus sp. W0125-5]|uniref:hypothetical protein n=1 Tax=Oceanirhabdus sp. W0125-5 TaxID=2999116 RepID=UPI0022F2C4F4|nr:hypothetical protein [Oceanirhabdus sp. W0125-5]WBW95060.1 hypothetical protein OW730_15345 [Oceanirhabdus sp. W0125-5]